jgi:hypothetical protein
MPCVSVAVKYAGRAQTPNPDISQYQSAVAKLMDRPVLPARFWQCRQVVAQSESRQLRLRGLRVAVGALKRRSDDRRHARRPWSSGGIEGGAKSAMRRGKDILVGTAGGHGELDPAAFLQDSRGVPTATPTLQRLMPCSSNALGGAETEMGKAPAETRAPSAPVGRPLRAASCCRDSFGPPIARNSRAFFHAGK